MYIHKVGYLIEYVTQFDVGLMFYVLMSLLNLFDQKN